ncbi:hypothetical protein DIE04_12835 [Burkholderia sp. Bp8994]|nr:MULTISPECIES: hypothetical protein [unclassified Burkholderia]RQR43823.1 hypothetical protein DIE20_10195 [Burkholderia sp. Bp9131]RQR75794.1 hypothetical protein DIE12_09025 [Burkholderia sp. Bp9015]RQR97369.1 hypothetical protein DIE04_12835 [Burkholderia sp. Bp8994]RQS32296.1 hypothetical protein DIE05_06445 [Burkholderia sp. Bp8995]RQS39447.1 hypothetical protein DIE01_17370 [Burkholderia sp. Bp8990]
MLPLRRPLDAVERIAHRHLPQLPRGPENGRDDDQFSPDSFGTALFQALVPVVREIDLAQRRQRPGGEHVLLQRADADHFGLRATLFGCLLLGIPGQQVAEGYALKRRPVDKGAKSHLGLGLSGPLLGFLKRLERFGLGGIALAANQGLVLVGATVRDGSHRLFLIWLGNRV